VWHVAFIPPRIFSAAASARSDVLMALLVKCGVAQTSRGFSSCHSSASSPMVRQPTFALANLNHVVRPSGSSFFPHQFFPRHPCYIQHNPLLPTFPILLLILLGLRDTALDFSKPVISAPCVRAGVQYSVITTVTNQVTCSC